VIIAHGAGNDLNSPLLVHLSEGLAEGGHMALRFNFIYREKGKRAPDRPDVLSATWRSVHQYLISRPECETRPVIAAGKPMGGRIASQMVSEGSLPVDRLILLGYPLHPPGKPEKLRDAHLYSIRIPMLFFAGSRDPLCDAGKLEKVLAGLKAPWELETIDGGNHSFRIPKAMVLSEEAVYGRILEKTLVWLEPHEGPSQGGRAPGR
jgi:hypothetical protein